MNNERVSFPSFRLQVLRALLNLDPNDSISHLPKLSRLIGRHFPKLLDKNRRCNLCSLRQTRRRTLYICSTCDTALCITPCFEDFHTKQSIP